MNWPHHRFWIQLRPDKHFRCCVGVKQRWQGKRSSGRLLNIFPNVCVVVVWLILSCSQNWKFSKIITTRFTLWNAYSLVGFLIICYNYFWSRLALFKRIEVCFLNEWKPAFYMNGSLVNDYVAIWMLHYGHEKVPPCPVSLSKSMQWWKRD